MGSVFATIRRSGIRRGPGRLLGGVCAAIATRTGVNVWAVRAVMLVLFLLPGIGVASYLLAWVLLPWQDGSIPLEQLLGARRGPRA